MQVAVVTAVAPVRATRTEKNIQKIGFGLPGGVFPFLSVHCFGLSHAVFGGCKIPSAMKGANKVLFPTILTLFFSVIFGVNQS